MGNLRDDAGARLEELVQGLKVGGVVPGSVVEVIAATWNGSEAVTLTYETTASSRSSPVCTWSRRVSENATTLKFDQMGFEES